jgi:hypothetical protein
MNKYEDFAMQFLPEDGSPIDKLARLVALRRINYGDGNLPKPNDHCYLTVDFFGNPVWEETDEHLRARVEARAVK